MGQPISTVAALNSDIAVQQANQQSEGGVATLSPPRKRQKGPKQAKKPVTKKSAKERASIAEVNEHDIQVLDNIKAMSTNLRDPKVKPADRKIAVSAAIAIMIGVGLGTRSKGFGPFVRAVINRLLGGMLGIKTVGRDKFTAQDLLKVLAVPNFKQQAIAALKTYLAGLKADAAATTLESRGKHAERAKEWINGDLHESYATALKVVMQLGGQVNFKGDKGVISMPLDRALGVAFGRNITAAELAKSTEKSVTK